MKTITMYSTGSCPYCIRARMLLERKGAIFTDIRIDLEPHRRNEMELRSRRSSVPQIFIGDQHIGGFDDMYVLELDGELDTLLKQVS